MVILPFGRIDTAKSAETLLLVSRDASERLGLSEKFSRKGRKALRCASRLTKSGILFALIKIRRDGDWPIRRRTLIDRFDQLHRAAHLRRELPAACRLRSIR